MSEAKTKQWKRERRLYTFDCARCGMKDAQSLKRRRARGGLCRKCRLTAVNEAQGSLFDFGEGKGNENGDRANVEGKGHDEAGGGKN